MIAAEKSRRLYSRHAATTQFRQTAATGEKRETLGSKGFMDILSKAKKGSILFNKSQIIELIRKDLNNNDYLMIKASLATGFNDIVKDLKGLH